MKYIKNIAYNTLLVGITALLAGYFTYQGVNGWYIGAEKPPFTPPAIVFRIVWPVLYMLLIASSSLILPYNTDFNLYKNARTLFVEQLLLQVLWTFLFFTQGYIGLALGCIILLDYIVFQMVRTFYYVNKTAAYLNAPYLLWLSFATTLNLFFVYIHGFIIFF